MFDWKEAYWGFLNLDHRKDRLIRMNRELDRVGLSAERMRGKLPEEIDDGTNPKYKVMWNRTKGALPCHYGQVAIIEKAYFHEKSCVVLEDDVVFCTDIKKRLDYINDFINTKEPLFDIIWMGGTYTLNPCWHKSENGKHTHPDLQMCNCTLNRDWEPTENKHIVRTYGCWSTYAYIVNYNSILKILKMLDDNIHLSMGIDWLFILLQPQLKTFAFNPGCVKQYDNKSDIGTGITYFSHSRGLGKHWFADKM